MRPVRRPAVMDALVLRGGSRVHKLRSRATGVYPRRSGIKQRIQVHFKIGNNKQLEAVNTAMESESGEAMRLAGEKGEGLGGG